MPEHRVCRCVSASFGEYHGCPARAQTLKRAHLDFRSSSIAVSLSSLHGCVVWICRTARAVCRSALRASRMPALPGSARFMSVLEHCLLNSGPPRFYKKSNLKKKNESRSARLQPEA